LTKNTSFGILRDDDKDDLNDSSLFERADDSNIPDDEHNNSGLQKTVFTKFGQTIDGKFANNTIDLRSKKPFVTSAGVERHNRNDSANEILESKDEKKKRPARDKTPTFT